MEKPNSLVKLTFKILGQFYPMVRFVQPWVETSGNKNTLTDFHNPKRGLSLWRFAACCLYVSDSETI